MLPPFIPTLMQSSPPAPRVTALFASQSESRHA
jgi:hypothetical protein